MFVGNALQLAKIALVLCIECHTGEFLNDNKFYASCSENSQNCTAPNKKTNKQFFD